MEKPQGGENLKPKCDEACLKKLRFHKTIVGDDPLVTTVISPQLGAGHVKTTPANSLFRHLNGSIGFTKEGHDGFLVGEPGVGRPFVVRTTRNPLAFESQILLKMKQQIAGRYLAAGEEILHHPIPVIAPVYQKRIRDRRCRCWDETCGFRFGMTPNLATRESSGSIRRRR